MTHSRSLAALVLFALSLGGCNIIGVVSDKFAGDLPIKPEYKPDPLRPMVVIAENYRDPSGNSDASRLAEIVSDRLAANNVAPIVSTERLMEVRDRSPMAYRKMSVVEIAKAVGAEQVVYIDLTSVGIGSQVGGSSFKGAASANVKLIDATTGAVLFPDDMQAGAAVGFESPVHQASADMTADRVRGETLLGLGTRIGHLFHTYRRSDMERIQSYE
jgi:hypothetical protein